MPPGRRGGVNKVMFGYSLNYLIDMEHSVILDVEATPTRISKEVDATETMIERTEERFALKPQRLAGDVAYGTGEMLGWLGSTMSSIRTYRSGTRASATMAPSQGPTSSMTRSVTSISALGAKLLKTTGKLHSDNTYRYIASKYDCDACALKPKMLSQHTAARGFRATRTRRHATLPAL